MFEIMKKSLLAGIGAIAMTEEKIQEMVEDLVKKGEISDQEGKTLVHDVRKAVEEQRARITSTVDERVRAILKELHLVTKDDIENLESVLQKDLAKIERRLSKMEKHLKDQDTAA